MCRSLGPSIDSLEPGDTPQSHPTFALFVDSGTAGVYYKSLRELSRRTLPIGSGLGKGSARCGASALICDCAAPNCSYDHCCPGCLCLQRTFSRLTMLEFSRCNT